MRERRQGRPEEVGARDAQDRLAEAATAAAATAASAYQPTEEMVHAPTGSARATEG